MWAVLFAMISIIEQGEEGGLRALISEHDGTRYPD